ncbi:MAG: STAS domain-containing protein [Anaerohalosphaeraceae bacterium]|nr:STAS domain-containing protein [Anaerohalosphaeraceae bacterium]
MKIKKQDYKDVTVIELHGEFVEEYCKTFQDEMAEVMRKDMAGIVVDVSKMPFIDSSGLEQLLWLREHCYDNRSQLKIAGIDDNFNKILEITRLEKEFDKYDELGEAVKSFT